MRSTIPALLLVLLACGCGSKEPASASAAPAPAPAEAARLIRKMQLSETEASHIEFESAYCKGMITIQPGVRIGYASVSTGPAKAGEAPSTRQLLTLDDKQFLFDGPELLIGPKSYGKLAGEAHVGISREGVVVNGEKRGAL